jgi:type III pantothenate kinase
MILTIDLSNTHVNIGGVADGSMFFSCQMAAVKTRTSDEYAALMRLMLEQHGVELEKLEGCILSSVVPELTLIIRNATELLTGIRPMVVGPGVKTGLNIRLDDPSELGSDFVAASLAAQDRYPLPIATVAMDTAMGIGITNASGTYIGGVIAPGVMVSSAALTRRASLLHNVVPQAPGHIICKNTDDSMRSGIIYGAAAMLDGLLLGIEEELGEPVNVVATGTWAPMVVPHCRRKNIHVDPDLIHRGLWLIWKKNQKNR